jgi:hypothetical protein
MLKGTLAVKSFSPNYGMIQRIPHIVAYRKINTLQVTLTDKSYNDLALQKLIDIYLIGSVILKNG